MLAQRVFLELATGDTRRSLKLLQRLDDMAPDQPFFRLAMLHEEERETLGQLNALLARGRFRDVEERVRTQQMRGGAPAVLSDIEAVATACQTFSAYRAHGPYGDSDSARNAMAAFRESDAVLTQSPTYRAWVTEQEAVIRTLVERETAVVLRQLLAAYDLAVVSCSPEVDGILCQIAALAPDHALLRTVEASLRSDWSRLLSTAARNGPDAGWSLQLTACQSWAALGPRERSAIRQLSERCAVSSLSGLLLGILAAVDSDDFEAAASGIRELVPMVDIGSDWIALLMEDSVLPRSQLKAGCWRTPFPAVTDILNRVIQLRERQMEESK